MTSADPVAELRCLYAVEALARADVEAIARNLAALHRRGDRALASRVLVAFGARHGAHVRDHVVAALDGLVRPPARAIAAAKDWAERAIATIDATTEDRPSRGNSRCRSSPPHTSETRRAQAADATRALVASAKPRVGVRVDRLRHDQGITVVAPSPGVRAEALGRVEPILVVDSIVR